MTNHRVAAALLMSGLAILLGVLGPKVVAAKAAQEMSFASGPGPVPLLELYTSEGCSSCPPADRWLSSLKADPGLWTNFVPVAFHVDYWDAIGWPDRFANSEFGERQRRYLRQGVVRGVYTPGVVAAGQEWRGWRQGRAIPALQGAGGELTATVARGQLRVSYAAPATAQASNYRVHAAWLGMDQVSKVHAGENRGKRLLNDFVVLSTSALPLGAADGQVTTRFDVPGKALADAAALAIWVSADGLQAPVQATGGWLK